MYSSNIDYLHCFYTKNESVISFSLFSYAQQILSKILYESTVGFFK